VRVAPIFNVGILYTLEWGGFKMPRTMFFEPLAELVIARGEAVSSSRFGIRAKMISISPRFRASMHCISPGSTLLRFWPSPDWSPGAAGDLSLDIVLSVLPRSGVQPEPIVGRGLVDVVHGDLPGAVPRNRLHAHSDYRKAWTNPMSRLRDSSNL
jgi:hypothetical protein